MDDERPTECGMSRKQFLLLTAAAVSAVGCEAVNPGGATASGSGRTIDAGPGANYPGAGPYANFHDVSFFLVRRDGKLVALSSICTHRHCKLTAEADRSFYC